MRETGRCRWREGCGAGLDCRIVRKAGMERVVRFRHGVRGGLLGAWWYRVVSG